MSQSITLKSFAELGEALNIEDLPADQEEAPVEEAASTTPATCTPNLKDLLAELEAAGATLATIARRDEEARSVALRDLERYDALIARQHEAEEAQQRASQVRREAEALSEEAFAEEARARAAEIVRIAVEAEVAALDTAMLWKREAEQLAAQLDLERVLAERRRQEEAEKAKVAAAEKARRLAGILAQARAALDAGRFEEAEGLLGSVTRDHPSNPEISSLKTIIAQRALSVKVNVAEEVLWQARRTYRHDSAAAVACLEVLDVDGLPEGLARQIFGEWARACSRLCRERGIPQPLRYAPEPGRGAVIVPAENGEGYTVVSSLGLGWAAGSAVSERIARRSRPLR